MYDMDESILHELKIYNIVQRRDYFLSSLIYQAANRLTPVYLSDHIIFNSDMHNFLTRRGHDIHLPKINCDIFRNSIIVRGGNLFNNLPDRIKLCSSLKSFKKLYSDHIFSA